MPTSTALEADYFDCSVRVTLTKQPQAVRTACRGPYMETEAVLKLGKHIHFPSFSAI